MNIRSTVQSLALVCLVACGFSEEKFLVDGVGLWCERSAECAGSFDATTCVDVFRSTDRSSCDYDPAAAKECFAALPDAACIEDAPFELMVLDVPASCESAYICAGAE